jgi:hypothetical protein
MVHASSGRGARRPHTVAKRARARVPISEGRATHAHPSEITRSLADCDLDRPPRAPAPRREPPGGVVGPNTYRLRVSLLRSQGDGLVSLEHYGHSRRDAGPRGRPRRSASARERVILEGWACLPLAGTIADLRGRPRGPAARPDGLSIHCVWPDRTARRLGLARSTRSTLAFSTTAVRRGPSSSLAARRAKCQCLDSRGVLHTSRRSAYFLLGAAHRSVIAFSCRTSRGGHAWGRA